MGPTSAGTPRLGIGWHGFLAQLSQDVETFEQLAQRPWALRHFRHTPRPYLTDEELSDLLDWEEDE